MPRTHRSPARCRWTHKEYQIVDPYVGGGFGSKLGIHSETILAAIAARMLEPVKVVVTRQQIFHLMGVRPTTSQRVRLGAGRDGRVVSRSPTKSTCIRARTPEFAEQTAATVRALYAATNRYTNHWLTPLDLPRGRTFERLERRRGLWRWNRRWTNWRMRWGWTRSSCRSRTAQGPSRDSGRTFGERRLVDCMREGARRFGWERRTATREPAGGPLAGGLWHGGGGAHALQRVQPGPGFGWERTGWR